MSDGTLPRQQGLYEPHNEHDSCGVGFVANVKGHKRHDLIRQGLQILKNLTHRGAVGADPRAGDGAGILIQMPDRFLREECAARGIHLPPAGEYGVGMLFLPQGAEARATCEQLISHYLNAEGQTLLGWREVPTNNTHLGESVKAVEPVVRQVFIGRGANSPAGDAFERKLFVIRKQIENAVRDLDKTEQAAFDIPSLSSRTLVYKGMLLANQVASYFPDLTDERLVTALSLVHQRFSTNTFPSWDLAQPFRMIAHNGEINTLRGNINWMAARRHAMTSELLGADLKKLWPLIAEGQSDSACFDNALELLVAGGYPLAHAMMLLIPEAWAGNPLMAAKQRAFYEYHAALMEPWDGPAAMAFTDGRMIGATLDRNGLRPARYLITDDDLVVMASEMGVLDIPQERIIKKWRLQPGKMLLIDLEAGRIIDDDELKKQLAEAEPYQPLLDQTQIRLEHLPVETGPMAPDPDTLLDRQQAFGYTQEDLKFLLTPMAVTGQEAVGSMGADEPLAVLSNRALPLSNYFKQRFAQVTNPPIDPIREELVMSLVSLIGPRPNLLGHHQAGVHKRLEVSQPVLTNTDLERIRRIEDHTGGAFRTQTLTICYPVKEGATGMEAALQKLCRRAEQAVHKGYNILILSDRGVDMDHVPIPALLATSAVHHHLVRAGLRTETGLVVETGAAREVHHFAVLAGYGAEAINPYLAFETLSALRPQLPEELSEEEIQKRYIKAIGKGLLKIMSKMGISTYQSYCGAQIFDAVGLANDFVAKYFTGTVSTIEGAGLGEIAEEAFRWHRNAYSDAPLYRHRLDAGGYYAYRLRGEDHMWTLDTIAKLQHASRANEAKTYEEYAQLVNQQSKRLLTLRGLFAFRLAAQPLPLAEVEPASEIVKRFATGAMSFGAISHEAHTTLAIAMNRIGGKSNTGEGGEEAERFKPLPNGDSMRSAIKQVASGRFGVTAEYLVNADDIQIKMAQGAKPGEGGQLPGHKVDATIAQVRHSTPGVGLISPPPHHDIYSIEDLAQLIFDLKNVNPQARISVKLVSEVGVGTVAAGVAKAHADHVTIAGHDGGTGASPLTSIKHAGLPWEIGLAETQQTLVLNRLRGRIAVQVDGGIRTGRDVVMGALLGADEFGFATAPLIVAGCIMMRKCHLNTCPTGVATQDPVLRKLFAGKPEHIVNYFFLVAEEVRQLMAQLGFRRFDDMIGRLDVLDTRQALDHWKAKGLDFSRILYQPATGPEVSLYNRERQDHGLDEVLDRWLIAQAQPALERQARVQIETPVGNTDRTVGAMLSGEVARRYGHKGLPPETIDIKARGTAGQSFGAFLAQGISLELVGEANDYVGKGLSGGRLVIMPPPQCPIVPEENIIIGNTVLYGAISGECYFHGVAGERFAVRNSGATAVVEGVGDHGCEYMTGGVVVVLGGTGRNFAAGMSGGIAYVLDEAGDFEQRCNLAMVELEPITEEDEALEHLEHQGGDLETHGRVDISHHISRFDGQRLRQLIEQHHRYTHSGRARQILENWCAYLPRFVKVMPVDYRRALQAMEQAQATRHTVTAMKKEALGQHG
ncbi:glutamate synthase large subunit [Nitrosococcus watsonii]|uniref:Glutamate synthase [NADPH] large chain n=1 Tax=Nitrosococcus watsoni (strain C-113) TaxID=105559 RepID=D8K6A1_NITWC|nr:glutamate synthase large subunit [Nitrosococcus watsonii]ADJ28428.1 Glutamate synthase (ferredoxin) [Nitrosococcus watsonii C-113]